MQRLQMSINQILVVKMDRVHENLQELFESDEDELNLNECDLTQRDIWSPEATKLLITTRLEMEDEFNQGKISKTTLWQKCLNKMKKEMPELRKSVVETRKKFSNLLVTYKRIKSRKKESGRAPVYWLHFENFDRVYGVRHNIVPPTGLTFDSSRSNRAEDNNCEQSVSTLECSSASVNLRPTKSNIASVNPRPTKCNKKRKGDGISDLLAYLKEEDEKENHRHEDLLKIEQEKNEIEKEKMKCLKEIVQLMKN